jgi:hypothetical protein
MLQIHGIDDGSAEYSAAKKFASIASKAIPEIDQDSKIVLHLLPSVQCFGSKTRDVDLLVFFADYRNTGSTNSVHSFCSCIEVKSHTARDVRFEGARCIVTYNGDEHDVTTQSENQKYSVKNYIGKHLKRGKPPYIHNLIWLTSVNNAEIPKSVSNIFASDATWASICNKLMVNSGPNLRAFSSRNYLNVIADIFNHRLEPSKIDRRKLEAITKTVLDRSQQQYVDKLGDQLLIYRGRGGTGKTVRLLQLAYYAYDTLGSRAVLLTYNKALVADLERLLTLLKIKDGVARGSIAVKTIQSFTYAWLKHMDVIEAGDGTNFLSKYVTHLDTAVNYIKNGAVTTRDIKEIKTKASKDLAWDLILIDESQDWPETERDLIYQLYGHKNVIIADGVDQFVRSVNNIDWREGINRSESQVVPLTKSLRLKSSLCATVGYFANNIEYANWNLQPHDETHGGNVIVVIGDAMNAAFHTKLHQDAVDDGNKPIDSLSCVPPSWVFKDNAGKKVSKVAQQYHDWGLQTWDAVSEDEREEYPTSADQYRIVQYESCRGLEGWIVIAYGLDEFFDFKRANPEISDIAQNDMFFDREAAALEYAKKWIMIPLTRAIDTLVLHVSDEHSYVGKALVELHGTHPESVNLLRF